MGLLLASCFASFNCDVGVALPGPNHNSVRGFRYLLVLNIDPHGEEARSAVSNHEAPLVPFILRDAAEPVIGRAFARPGGGSSG
jgi:hypothetical protein